MQFQAYSYGGGKAAAELWYLVTCLCASTSGWLTFSCQQGPHFIRLRVVGVVQDEVLHNDAVGLSRGTPVHLDCIGVEGVQPQVRWRGRGTW